jgi:hypothetical protein
VTPVRRGAARYLPRVAETQLHLIATFGFENYAAQQMQPK